MKRRKKTESLETVTHIHTYTHAIFYGKEKQSEEKRREIGKQNKGKGAFICNRKKGRVYM